MRPLGQPAELEQTALHCGGGVGVGVGLGVGEATVKLKFNVHACETPGALAVDTQVPVWSVTGGLPSDLRHKNPLWQSIPCVPPQTCPSPTVTAAAGLLLGTLGATDCCLN